MGNCKSKAHSDVIDFSQPNGVDKSVFRFDKDARQIVFVGEDAETAEITAVGSSQSDDTTNEPDTGSCVTENSTTLENQKSLLGEITEFLEHDEENSTVCSQSTRGRNSPMRFFKSPPKNTQDHSTGYHARSNMMEERALVEIENDRRSVSPLAFESDMRYANQISRHPYVLGTDPSEDESDGTAYSRDSSTLNGLRHVLSGETDSVDREKEVDADQSLYLLEPRSEAKERNENSVLAHQANQIKNKKVLHHLASPNDELERSQILLLDDDTSDSSLDNIEASLQEIQTYHQVEERPNSTEIISNDEYDDEGYIPLTKSSSNDSYEGHDSDDEITKITDNISSSMVHEGASERDSANMHGFPLKEVNPSFYQNEVEKADHDLNEKSQASDTEVTNSHECVVPQVTNDIMEVDDTMSKYFSMRSNDS